MNTVDPRPSCHDDCTLQAVTQVATLLRHSGHEVTVAGGVTALTAAGLAAWLLLARRDPAGAMVGVLVMGGLVRSLALIVLAHRPLLASIGRIRQAFAATGNPTWTPVAAFVPPPPDRRMALVRAFISAAYVRQELSRRALRWAGGTMVCFVLAAGALSVL
ncbi:hypothetical protein [Thermoactinospora rubra]|uniref:hypothetical protein n=1 Tax=Thermoactinospora rubra TaxID=1088767 RepID=UPI000A102DCE|nr:hypothetical protein [Thermoactinospora rubra]